MADAWSQKEIELIVSDYLEMLKLELSQQSYKKAAHNRDLRENLQNRSKQSVEYKHRNISAILRELGAPSIDGYKPATNYQRQLLPQMVESMFADRSDLQVLIEKQVEATPQPLAMPSVEDLVKRLVAAPEKRPPDSYQTVNEQKANIARKYDYLERDARNRKLGLLGEEFAVAYEKARLIIAGKDSLADKIEHTSVERGDGPGFDIRSFEADGSDRLIEVKTTRFGLYTPFYLSENERRVSQYSKEQYQLYRVFNFGKDTGLFTLPGAVESNINLSPTQYIARF